MIGMTRTIPATSIQAPSCGSGVGRGPLAVLDASMMWLSRSLVIIGRRRGLQTIWEAGPGQRDRGLG
jgi:hypothetical protein